MADKKPSSASIVSLALSVPSAAILALVLLGVHPLEDAIAASPILAVAALEFGIVGRRRREPRRSLATLGIVVSTLSLAAFAVVLAWSASRA